MAKKQTSKDKESSLKTLGDYRRLARKALFSHNLELIDYCDIFKSKIETLLLNDLESHHLIKQDKINIKTEQAKENILANSHPITPPPMITSFSGSSLISSIDVESCIRSLSKGKADILRGSDPVAMMVFSAKISRLSSPVILIF